MTASQSTLESARDNSNDCRMNSKTFEEINLIAPILVNWRDRSEPPGMIDYLRAEFPAWRYALAVTEALETSDWTAGELAEEVHLTRETVRHVIRALKQGGYPIEQDWIPSLDYRTTREYLFRSKLPPL